MEPKKQIKTVKMTKGIEGLLIDLWRDKINEDLWLGLSFQRNIAHGMNYIWILIGRIMKYDSPNKRT